MAKKCCDKPADVPAWFMTYSDVITLLMTFFILLLTFATNEPENFERMQVAMFGGGSATGLAGHNDEAIDQDSLLLRIRPKTARLTIRGSEMPPLYSDPSTESLDEGLKTLTEPHDLADAERLSINMPLPLLIDQDGEVSDIGKQQMRMVASQMRKLPLEVRFEVADSKDVPGVLKLADELVTQGHIAPGRIAVSVTGQQTSHSELHLTVMRVTAR
ncbi:MAG: hypothetical protein KDA86_18735 [Planctomycetaceae bacterium]|nr:hypothetical protein [Planctomycetaceae bacterium]